MSDQLAKATGGCHCGAVRFSIATVQDSEMLQCNCSMCSRFGYLHLFVLHENFELQSGKDALTSYRFGSKNADHLFCKICGVKSFYQPRSHPESYSVNFSCLDQGHSIRASITPFDGQNWDKSAAAKGLG
ncbi:MAG: GFA family protein [Marinomonas sp.]